MRKVTDVSGLADHGVETLRAHPEYLEAADRFRPSSAKLPVLLRELERAAPRFAAGMVDTRQYAMAKRFMSAAPDEGIDVTDDEAFETRLEAFNARPPGERAAFLGPLLADVFVVDGDPTSDITLLADPEQNLALIAKGGHIVKNRLAVRSQPRDDPGSARSSTPGSRRCPAGARCER